MLKKHKLILAIIILVAFFLRIYRFRQGETFMSSDEVYLFQNSLKPLTFLIDDVKTSYFAELFRFFNFNWGWVVLFPSTLFSLLINLLNLSVNEITINLPYIFIGTATIYLFYLLGKELKNKYFGFIAALILAIHPVHVSTSRSIGLIGIVATFFFILTLYLFIKYFKHKKNKNIAYLSLGFYFASDFQFYGILPLIVIIGVLIKKQNNFIKNLFGIVKELLLSKSIIFFLIPIIPIILSALYLYTKDFVHNSYIFHIFQKSSYFGFFLFDTVVDLYSNLGPTLFILFIISFIYVIIKCLISKRVNKFHYWVFIWVCLHLLPWLFIVNRQYTIVYEYIYNLNSGFIFLSAFFVNDLCKIIKNKFLIFLLIMIIIIPTFFVTSTITYNETPFINFRDFLNHSHNINQNKILNFNLHFGHVGRNTGIKSAGYYLREYSPINSVIFSDHEIFITEYYSGRKVVGSLDLFSEDEIINNYLTLNNISYIYLENKEYKYLKNIIQKEGFKALLNVYSNKALLGTLYSKNVTYVINWDVNEFDKLFNIRYGNMNSLYVDYT